MHGPSWPDARICDAPSAVLCTDTTKMYEKTYTKSKENPGGSPKDPLINFKPGDPPVKGPKELKKEAAAAEPPKEEAKKE